MNQGNEPVLGVVLDETTEFSLTEICQACEVHAELVIELVYEGIADPRGEAPATWRFSGPELPRLQRALRLQQDLQINWPGVALALDLLDEIARLRGRLRAAGDV